MPSKTVDLAVLDTSVYIENFHTLTEQIWMKSGDIVARIAAEKGYERRKIQELSQLVY